MTLSIGPFAVRFKSRLESLAGNLHLLYFDYPLVTAPAVVDFHISLDRPKNLRRWHRRQVVFSIDGRPVFEPFPANLIFPLLEWGLNWCIAKRCHQYLMLHAAVVEREGRAIIFPAIPGSGKSTLCAALIHRGWRLLSDEFGLVHLEHRNIIPLPRPIPLKNESIAIIRGFASDSIIGPLFPKTRKGTVAHLRPPASSVCRMTEPARAKWVVFPQFKPSSPFEFKQVPKAHSLLRLATNAFNYEVLGAHGFHLVSELIRSCDCYNLIYRDLNQAIAHLNSLVDER